jgi:hypothetical protein
MHDLSPGNYQRVVQSVLYSRVNLDISYANLDLI